MEKKKINNIFIICTLVIVGVAGGGTLGYFLGERYNPALIPEANSDTVVRDDLNEVCNRINNYVGDKNIEDINFANVSQFTASDIVNYGISNFKHSQNITQISHGESVTNGSIKMTQEITCSYIKNGNKYFKERLSNSSLVKLATRFYNFDILTENSEVFENFQVDTYLGSIIDSYNATFDNNKISYTTEEDFLNTYGINYNEAFVYTICNDALINRTTIQGIEYSTGVTKIENGYQVTLALDPSKSTVDYRKEMLSTTDMDIEDGKEIEPRFTNVALVFNLDDKLNIVSYSSSEHYWVKKIGWNEMDGHMNYFIYSEDESLTIPTLEESIPYQTLIKE